MFNIKVRLTYTLPGRVLVSPQECGEQLTEMRSFVLKEGKALRRYSYRERLLRRVVATSAICEEAYRDYVSDHCPSWFRSKAGHPKKVWKGMSKKDRLEAHLKVQAESMGGVLQSYEVFEEGGMS